MILKILATLAAAIVLVGCGGSSGSPEPSAPSGDPTRALAAPGEGSLLIANLNAIVERNLKSGEQRNLLTLTEPNSFVLDPAVSPDGTQVAFIKQPPAKIVEGRFDAGSDLWVMGRDGSEPHLVFEHAQPNQLVRFPRWEDNANILAIVQEIHTEADLTRVVYTLERIDVASGQRQIVLEDILAFDISPDGQRLVYAKLLPQVGESLQVSDLAGASLIEIIGLDQLLAPFGYPRFSPDGETIGFASADQTGARVPVQLVSLSRAGLGHLVAPVDTALLDGLPQDVWTVAASGGQAVRVADLKEDLPSMTWDGSGDHIYAMGVEGLYDINLTTGGVERLADGAFHAQLTWAP